MTDMTSFLRRLFRRKPKRVPIEMHRLPWSPTFYRVMGMHIEETTRR